MNGNIKSLARQLKGYLKELQQYSLVIYLLFIAVLFGFVLFQVSNLRDVAPSQSEVSNQVQAAQVPHIDEKTVQQLESLQDNSVSVQTLFNNARSNPF